MNRYLIVLLCAMPVAAWSTTASMADQDPSGGVWDEYKYSYDGINAIPDVNKSSLPPAPADKSCWLATASNMLAAAGWGLAAQTPQLNATQIYGHMTGHFTTQWSGDPAMAINWWLYEYGYNPNQAAGGWYRPTLTYNDVTSVAGALTEADYNFLLDELDRCQYVGVTFPTDAGDHCLTLVGGNYGPSSPNYTGAAQQSVWHDSDRDNPGPDDPYANSFAAGTGAWSLPTYPTYQASGYTTLCPGVQKPDSAMSNYDAAYYRDMDPISGSTFKTWRIAGAAQYGMPDWKQDQSDEYTILRVPNEQLSELHKEVYLLVDYIDRAYDPEDPGSAATITLLAEDGISYDSPEIDISADGGQILYHWTLENQPLWEEIIFPNEDYFNLSGNVKDFNIATECVPEPCTLGLLGLVALGKLLRRRN